jgi:hypothetical protein
MRAQATFGGTSLARSGLPWSHRQLSGYRSVNQTFAKCYATVACSKQHNLGHFKNARNHAEPVDSTISAAHRLRQYCPMLMRFSALVPPNVSPLNG